MTNPLHRKLSCFSAFSGEDEALLDQLCADQRDHPAGSDLIHQGDSPKHVFLLIEGWAYRYKVLPDGSRQIMAYLVPGDLCDVHVFILKRMDHSIGILNDAKVAAIPERAMLDVLQSRPAIAQALLWSTLVDEAILREWLTNIGQRDAYERIAHLFCELWLRMSLVQKVRGDAFELPLTQQQLGETVGLTSVHVNRVLQRMRAEGLITLDRKCLTILDIDRLKAISDFDPDYLHLERRMN